MIYDLLTLITHSGWSMTFIAFGIIALSARSIARLAGWCSVGAKTQHLLCGMKPSVASLRRNSLCRRFAELMPTVAGAKALTRTAAGTRSRGFLRRALV